MIEYDNWLKNKCPEHKLVYRYKYTSDNRMFIVKQCSNCDYQPSHKYKKSDIENLEFKINTGQIKESLPDTNWEEYRVYRNSELNLMKLKNDEINEKRKENYQIYIKSSEWFKIRKLVLKRDNYTCQGCLEKEATEVHHKNYDHLFNEILFDLVSVCKACHDKIHLKKQI
jgi:hypothetical protein